MAGKRQATTNLTHDNWDQEEEPEDRGTFRKAPEEELKNRVIKKARRKVPGSGTDAADGAPKSIFSGFAGFGKMASTPTASTPFSFLSKLPVASSGTASSSGAATSTTKPTFSFGSAISKPPEAKDTSDSSSTAVTGSNGNEKSANYYAKLKGLNQAVSDWIKTHVDKNPLCILTPIFKDYEKYLKEIETDESGVLGSTSEDCNTKEQKAASTAAFSNFVFSVSNSSPTTTAATASTSSGTGMKFNFGNSSTSSPTNTTNTTKTSIFGGVAKASDEEPKKSNGFSFGIKPDEKSGTSAAATTTTSTTKSFSFGAKTDDTSGVGTAPFSFGKATTGTVEGETKAPTFSFTASAKPFSFGNTQQLTAASSTTANTNAEETTEEDDQPPKVEFKQVVEEDAVYTKKCKVFVKKDGNYADRGVGTLYLKPVKDSEKTQLLVRADTNLGNILINLILSAGIPTQRMGKNNVMMVCLPTPDEEKAMPILLRVKTAEEADELLATLEKYKK